jgi:hypothetical protein
MTSDQKFTIIIALLGVVIIPLLALVVRGAMKWTQLATDVRKIAEDSVRDREVTDRRLRWLEENTWKKR